MLDAQAILLLVEQTATRSRCGARRLAVLARAAGAFAFLVVVLLVGGAGIRSTITHVAGKAGQSPSAEAIVPDRVIQLFNGRDLPAGSRTCRPRTRTRRTRQFHCPRRHARQSRQPRGHLLTESVYRDYRLEVEYRFPGKPGNCGVLVHASRLRALSAMFPQSIEVQMNHLHAGDFWCIEENIEVPDMETRRPRKEGQKYGGSEGDARRILNLTDNSEKPLGEWNSMIVEARGRTVKVWVNGDLVNEGFNSTADRGRIAIQAEGAEVEFRRVQMGHCRPS